MLLNLKYQEKKHQSGDLLTSNLPVAFVGCVEAGKFEVLIPVGIPGEGMLGSRWKYQRCQKQLYTREINMEHNNEGLEDDFPFQTRWFSGSMRISQGVC